MTLHDFVSQYGYAALFIGTFLEGETILLIAGYLAHQGHLQLPYVILAAFLGTAGGDQLLFLAGRAKGIAFLSKWERLRLKSQKALDLLQRHQTVAILGFRFLYGVRSVVPFAIGASGLDSARFFLLNLAGALIWAAALGLLGYQFGLWVALLFEEAERYELEVLALLVGIGLAVWLRANLRGKGNCKP